MVIKKSIIIMLALIGTSLFAKGPLLDGEYTGVNPLDSANPIRLTFKLVNSETTIASCNFNYQCQAPDMAASLRAILDSDMFMPNGDNGWRVGFENSDHKRVFDVLFNDPQGNGGVVLKLLGLGLDIPLKKVAAPQ